MLALACAGICAAENPVVGRVGDIEITADEFREALAGVEAEHDAPLSADAATLGQYARALLIQRLVLKQASGEKWDQNPAVIARLVRARETALAESWLAAKATPPADYPAEPEVAEAYEANKNKLAIPKSYHLAQIYISVSGPEDADSKTLAAARKRLDGVLKNLAAKGADFAAIARKSSEETSSAADGGRIGWLTEEQILPEIRAKLPKLSLGAVSEPIRLKDGWHIVKVLDIREARTPTLAEVRDNLVTRLRAKRARIMRDSLIAGLLKEHPVAINEIELTKLLTKP
jgi:parvulin-like peptidyl-prolyl isomerase